MLRVLIAEDEDMIRKGLVYTTDWLSMGCVVVAEASDGKDGYEKILECRPDVVITDICMPFMDGIEMIKKASEQVKFKSIHVTVINRTCSVRFFFHAGSRNASTVHTPLTAIRHVAAAAPRKEAAAYVSRAENPLSANGRFIAVTSLCHFHR